MTAGKVLPVIFKAVKKLLKMWRYNQGIVCLVQRRDLCPNFFFLNFLDTHAVHPVSFFPPRCILKTPSYGAQFQPLFLYSLSVTSNFCVIPFSRRTMETSCVLAKMHLYAHKAKFFTIGPSIGIFSFQQLFAGMEAQQDLVCAAESAAFYRLTDKNDWMANASSLTTSRMELRSLKAEPLLSLRGSRRTEEAVAIKKKISRLGFRIFNETRRSRLFLPVNNCVKIKERFVFTY